MSMNVWLKNGKVYNLVSADGVTGNTTGEAIYKDSPKATFQASATAGGAGTIVIQFSNDASNWIVGGTITLAGATLTDGFSTDASWKYVRAVVSGVTGTVTVLMGV